MGLGPPQQAGLAPSTAPPPCSSDQAGQRARARRHPTTSPATPGRGDKAPRLPASTHPHSLASSSTSYPLPRPLSSFSTGTRRRRHHGRVLARPPSPECLSDKPDRSTFFIYFLSALGIEPDATTASGSTSSPTPAVADRRRRTPPTSLPSTLPSPYSLAASFSPSSPVLSLSRAP